MCGLMQSVAAHTTRREVVYGPTGDQVADLDAEACRIVDELATGQRVTVKVLSRGDRRAFKTRVERFARHRGLLTAARLALQFTTTTGHYTPIAQPTFNKPQKRAVMSNPKGPFVPTQVIPPLSLIALIATLKDMMKKDTIKELHITTGPDGQLRCTTRKEVIRIEIEEEEI